MATLQEKYGLGLKTLGYHLMRSNNTEDKYQIFWKHQALYVFLGTAGAVRMGHSRRLDQTFPAAPDFKATLLMRGEQELQKQLQLK